MFIPRNQRHNLDLESCFNPAQICFEYLSHDATKDALASFRYIN